MKILLTNHQLDLLAGSEIHTLELSEALTDLGHDVTIVTFKYDFPFKFFAEKRNLNVISMLDSGSLKNEYFDLIWSHHYLVLTYCLFEREITADRIIFSALSPFEPLEAPPVFANELSLCLANSEETMMKLMEEGVEKRKLKVLYNLAPEKFYSKYVAYEKTDFSSVAIVSSHVPHELRGVVDIFRSMNMEIMVYGKSDNYEEITPELLSRYDLLITVGKTVQYALVQGVPVYCYDIFGGPGFIGDENFDVALMNNFSGRGFTKKTAEEIVCEIQTMWPMAFHNRELLRQRAWDLFSAKQQVERVLDLAVSEDKLDLKKMLQKNLGEKRRCLAYARNYRDLQVLLYERFLLSNRLKRIKLVCEGLEDRE